MTAPADPRVALLAYALLDDGFTVALAHRDLGAGASKVRDLLLDDTVLATARLCGLEAALRLALNPMRDVGALHFARAVDALRLSDITEAGSFQHLIRAASRTAPRLKERRDAA